MTAMKIRIPKESVAGETRVAATPETVAKMVKAGFEVGVEQGAGIAAGITDKDFRDSGAQIIADTQSTFSEADLVLKVGRPSPVEIDSMKQGALLISFLQPFASPEVVDRLAKRGVSALAMELMPRITRAQRMDALSAMGSVAGYKAVLLAADASGRFFPMLTTAAGTIPPAKVIVIGAGVAGLQAIATAKRLGGQVTAFDPRPAAGEQVRSLGVEFVDMAVSHEQAQDAGGYAKELTPEFYKEEQELIRKFSRDADVIITTANIPGKRAPTLITEEMVGEMRPGSVIVDLAVEAGGNCILTELNKRVTKHSVVIIGFANLPAMLPIHASQLYARNIFAFLGLLSPEGKSIKLDLGDEIIKNTLVTHQGAVVHPAVVGTLKKGGA